MEEINLNAETFKSGDDGPNITEINISDKPSVNFGGGIELLMNDKKKEQMDNPKKNDGGISLSDLNSLDNDLENISLNLESETNDTHVNKSNFFEKTLNNIGNIGNFGKPKEDTDNINLENIILDDNPIGKSTAKLEENVNKTWDGFKPMASTTINKVDVETKSKEEILREKFTILRKLEALEQKGIHLTKKYTMDSSLSEMQGEYENIIADKERKSSVKFQGKVLTALITGIEFLNNRFDPFDVKLDGWSEQFNENLDDYDEIFAELHDKYHSKAKMAPELKLLFQLGASGMMIHMTNTMFKSAIPGMDDIMKQNPELMQQFTQAAVNTMGESNPGVSQFMNTFSGRGPREPPSPQMTGRPFPNAMNRGPPSPNMNSANESAKSVQMSQQPSRRNTTPVRREMSGPNDVASLLSGLKTSINLNDEPNESTISIEDLSSPNKSTNVKSGRRKQKSDRNTVSLDI